MTFLVNEKREGTVTVRVSRTERERLNLAIAATGYSRSDLVRLSLLEFLQRLEQADGIAA